MRHSGLETLAIGLAMTIASQAASQPTAPTRLAWSTYLRTGPSDAAQVVDELIHDQVVGLGPCSGRWCQVTIGRTVGYVDRDALVLPRTPAASAATGAQDCFTAGMASYRGKSATRFCSTVSGRAAP